MNFFKNMITMFHSADTKKNHDIIKNFYTSISKNTEDATLNKLIEMYRQSGFKIEENQVFIISEDPFRYMVKNCPGKFLNIFWKDLFSSEYKQKIIKEQQVFKSLFNCVHNNNDKLDKWLDKSTLDFYLNNVLDLRYCGNVEKLQKKITTSLNELKTYPGTNAMAIEKLRLVQAQLSKVALSYDVKELAENFAIVNEKVIQKLPTDTQKTIGSLIKTMRLYDKEFSEYEKKEQFYFKEILTTLDKTNESKYLSHNIEGFSYIERLLQKHLPEVLSDYFEIPLKIRTAYKDDKGKTPQAVFAETLEGINTKIKTISEEVFDNNFTQIKVKNRLIKMQG